MAGRRGCTWVFFIWSSWTASLKTWEPHEGTVKKENTRRYKHFSLRFWRRSLLDNGQGLHVEVIHYWDWCASFKTYSMAYGCAFNLFYLYTWLPPLRKDTDQSRLALCAPDSAFSGSERTIVEASAVFISTGKRRTDGDSRFKWLEGSRLEYKLDLKKLDWYKLNGVAAV